ncbi:ABC transporter ATP-binding protein [Lacisediminihabitans profunda]|uniref:ATP-binding cassette domain-containing protein n=1 Tax=Lacisediminihabitans profunda TaxID=2594790 RepID=A0A5C8UUG8_9MICO|nr:ABC transporter ATP-binding protein [Lacisediminihabitans profunda]TXN31286.1 ATP-binding cassette domain-containing protein [Lacisediminihabitans profunda]
MTVPAQPPAAVVDTPAEALDPPIAEDPVVEALVIEDAVVDDLVVEAPLVAPAPATRTVTRKPATPAKAPTQAPTKATITTAARTPAPESADADVVLELHDLVKRFGDTVAVDHVSLSIPTGSIFGIVGPNGAGKTTTLSMVTGLLRPDGGTIAVHGADVWSDPIVAKRNMGVLPDRLRLFDRLTGGQLLYYAGILRGLDPQTVKKRSADLASAFGLEDALDRLVADYSAGMTKKVALASAMIHSPRLLILDEPFESVDPVSAANVTEILQNYAAAGGTVVLSSHSMDLVQRICDYVAIVVSGSVLASGTMDEVRGIGSLEERFVELAGGRKTAEGMEWLHSFSD